MQGTAAPAVAAASSSIASRRYQIGISRIGVSGGLRAERPNDASPVCLISPCGPRTFAKTSGWNGLAGGTSTIIAGGETGRLVDVTAIASGAVLDDKPAEKCRLEGYSLPRKLQGFQLELAASRP